MKRLVLIVAILLVALPTLVSAQEMPTVTLPEPTGDFAVGRTVLHLIDQARPDTYTETPDDYRELMIFAWYPADADPAAPAATWLGADLAEAVGPLYDTDPALLDLIKVHALDGVPVSAALPNYPVLIMSHGGDGSHPLFYTTFAEELASHGYIVLGITHTYNAAVTVFPDGRVVPMLPEGSALYSTVPADAPAFDQLTAAWDHCQVILDLFAGDAVFVVDQLETLNADHPLLAGKLDLSRIGMFGHSFGGAASVEALRRDSRILAAANLDGSLWDYYPEGVPGPVLFFAEEGMSVTKGIDDVPDDQLALAGVTREQFDTILRPQFDASHNAYLNSAVAYSVMINGTAHLNFGDTGLLAAVFPDFDMDLGPIDPVYALRITNDYLVAFFGFYLNGTASDLLSGSAQYPEVVFDYHVAE